MTLIKSISGIRGTIGGKQGDNLTPLDIIKFTAAYATYIKSFFPETRLRIVVGRDARISGEMVSHLVVSTLQMMGADVTDLGLSTTPTVEIAVTSLHAQGGLILTASHNPANWNALKLLNHQGEFLDDKAGTEVLRIAESDEYAFAPVEALGKVTLDHTFIEKHIDMILQLPLVDKNAISKAGLKIAIDCVNSTGGIAIPALLRRLGVEVIELYCLPDGNFPHNPEPLPQHLAELSSVVVKYKASLGFAVDPDVDRLAIVCENGEMFGEEYTLVAVSDYILRNHKGNTVSNMSSTRALIDITVKAGGSYFPSAVGEVNVVAKMKEVNAVIGGEGNGGVIYPELHYGRDALVGIALFLTYLVKSGKSCLQLRKTYPEYVISKNKISLPADIEVDTILKNVADKYREFPVNTIDGVKIEFDREWVHLRKSNTEPIIRIYAESSTAQKADELAGKIIEDINLAMK